MSEPPLISTLSDDPDFDEVVDDYVAVLPVRMEEIARAVHAGDRRRVEVVAHQLVGSGGSAGFQPISEAARRLEEAAKEGSPEALARSARDLAALCARARAR